MSYKARSKASIPGSREMEMIGVKVFRIYSAERDKQIYISGKRHKGVREDL